MKTRATVVALIVFLSFIPGHLHGTYQAVQASNQDTSPRDQLPEELLVSAVMAYADGMLPDDELIKADDLWAKKSNYQGVVLGDRTYYYCLAPHFCSCPVCRGTLNVVAVNVVYLDQSAVFPMAIYTLTNLLFPQLASRP
jgi:hypothetical protein